MEGQRRKGVYIYKGSYDGEEIAEDPNLGPAEKESAICWAVSTNTATVCTKESPIMRRLLQSSYFKLREGEFIQQGKKLTLVGVIGDVPVGSVQLKAPRGGTGHGLIVSSHRPERPPGKVPAKGKTPVAALAAAEAKRAGRGSRGSSPGSKL